MAIMPLSPLSHMKDAMQQVEVRLQAKRSEVKKHEKKAEAVAKEGMKLKEQLREIEEVHNKWLAYFDKGHVTAAQVTNGIAGTEGDEGEASSDTEVGTQLRKPATLKRNSMRASPTKRQCVITPDSPTSPPSSSAPFPASGSNNPEDVHLANATTVIKDPAGDNIEIWCGICGGNANTGSDTLLVGWKGMYDHIRNEHAADPRAHLRSSESAFELVYHLSRHRAVSEDEAEAIESGERMIELVIPWKKQEEAIQNRTPTKHNGVQHSGGGGTSKKSRIKKVECHNCLTKFRGNEPHSKCRYCSLVVCSLQSCQDDLESAVGHDECGKEPEEQTVDDFESLNGN